MLREVIFNDWYTAIIIASLIIIVSAKILSPNRFRELLNNSNYLRIYIKDHKFFNENTVCPTCDQDIEESFRLNRIEHSQDKAKELQKGYEELLVAIKEEENRESHFKSLSGEIIKTSYSLGSVFFAIVAIKSSAS